MESNNNSRKWTKKDSIVVSSTSEMIYFVTLLFGCLEKVTGQEVPLDPDYYEGVEEIRGSSTEGGGSSTPFSTVKTEKISVTGMIESPNEMSIDIDVRVPDATAPGGMLGKGKILIERPGRFELRVPKNLGKLELQAFQDIDSDGPNGEDPFAQIFLDIEDDDIENVQIELIVGGRGAAPEHASAPPGSPNDISEGVPENPDPFGGVAGDRIKIQGNLICDGCPRIDLDLFTPDETSPGGRKMLGKMKLEPGDYVIMVPKNFGHLILEAFIDFKEDGPGEGDMMGYYLQNPVQIVDKDISGIDITLIYPTDGRMPTKEVAPEKP
jgi:hypothetical protein